MNSRPITSKHIRLKLGFRYLHIPTRLGWSVDDNIRRLIDIDIDK